MLQDETGEGFRLGVRDDSGRHLVGGAIFDGSHGRLSNGSTSLQFGAFGLRHILPLSAEIRLVSLDRAGEQGHSSQVQTFPYPVSKVPSRLLCYVQVTMQLHGGNALEAGSQEVGSKQPSLIAEFGGLHNRPDPDAEPLVAIAATIRHGRMLGSGLDVGGAAMDATDFLRPPPLYEPFLSGFIVGKSLEESAQ